MGHCYTFRSSLGNALDRLMHPNERRALNAPHTAPRRQPFRGRDTKRLYEASEARQMKSAPLRRASHS